MDVVDWHLILETLGGIGLFLLGMLIMTDGLKSLGGRTMRANLMAYTRSPLSGAMCGTLCTALLQSSSAVTVATVGFVRAGLMSFRHSLGVIFGANIGTTLTGWLVLLFGFKIKLGLLVFPLIFGGALLRLFARHQLAALGMALAGFGLIFTGIDLLQNAMQGMRDYFDFSAIAASGLLDRFVIMAIGIGFTLITQSSSAGVAATLTALFSGLIHFEQAAALVVGMDIGTTVTAVMATTGAATAARRTGYSHVIYNLVTGLTALLIITPYIWVWESVSSQTIEAHAEIALITFHSTFNLLGVCLVLPFTQQFAHMMQRLVPDAGEGKEYLFEDALLEEPELAMDAGCEALRSYLLQLARLTLNRVRGLDPPGEQSMMTLGNQLDTAQAFIDRIPVIAGATAQRQRLVDMLHALDHLQRLLERCEDLPRCRDFGEEQGRLGEAIQQLIAATEHAMMDLKNHRWQHAGKTLVKLHKEIHAAHTPYRAQLLGQTADDLMPVPDATLRLDAFRWLDRVSIHLARSVQYIADASMPPENA